MDLILNIMTYIFLVFLIILLFATSPIIPFFYLRKLKGIVPDEHLKNCRKSFWQAWYKNLLTIPFDLTAPVIVPIALIFTKWEDEKLPFLFRMWDNEVSINGDVGLVPYDKNNRWALDKCYWAKGHHPRSFYARFIWLGIRNRATYPAWKLGYRAKAGDIVQSWREGNVQSGRGWLLHRVGSKYRFRYANAPIRIHYGYKVGGVEWEAPGNVVAIGFSLKKFK